MFSVNPEVRRIDNVKHVRGVASGLVRAFGATKPTTCTQARRVHWSMRATPCRPSLATQRTVAQTTRRLL